MQSYNSLIRDQVSCLHGKLCRCRGSFGPADGIVSTSRSGLQNMLRTNALVHMFQGSRQCAAGLHQE